MITHPFISVISVLWIRLNNGSHCWSCYQASSARRPETILGSRTVSKAEPIEHELDHERVSLGPGLRTLQVKFKFSLIPYNL